MPVPPLHPVTLPLEVPPAETVLLTAAQTELPLPPDSELSHPPVINKPVPALLASLVTELETGDKPMAHFPQLVMPTMFLPIPNVHLGSYSIWWLTHCIPHVINLIPLFPLLISPTHPCCNFAISFRWTR